MMLELSLSTSLLISTHPSFPLPAHFALKKFDSQTSAVHIDAPYYNWKVGIPTFEFGTMHALLFQLAILPLTMCRLVVSTLSSTFLNNYIPFNEMTKCHIFIGYTFIVLLLAALLIFFLFFGVVCNSGDASFCKKVRFYIYIYVHDGILFHWQWQSLT